MLFHPLLSTLFYLTQRFHWRTVKVLKTILVSMLSLSLAQGNWKKIKEYLCLIRTASLWSHCHAKWKTFFCFFLHRGLLHLQCFAFRSYYGKFFTLLHNFFLLFFFFNFLNNTVMKNCYLGIIDRAQILSSSEPAEIAANFGEKAKKVNVSSTLFSARRT